MKGGEDKMLSKFVLILAILILLSPFINASPYGYGDSMDLKYRIADGKIYYKYGNSTAYTTSLRPKDADRNWKADIRREVVDSKVAREIFKEEKQPGLDEKMPVELQEKAQEEQPKDVKMEDFRKQVGEQLKGQKFQQEAQKWISDLKASAKIKTVATRLTTTFIAFCSRF